MIPNDREINDVCVTVSVLRFEHIAWFVWITCFEQENFLLSFGYFVSLYNQLCLLWVMKKKVDQVCLFCGGRRNPYETVLKATFDFGYTSLYSSLSQGPRLTGGSVRQWFGEGNPKNNLTALKYSSERPNNWRKLIRMTKIISLSCGFVIIWCFGGWIRGLGEGDCWDSVRKRKYLVACVVLCRTKIPARYPVVWLYREHSMLPNGPSINATLHKYLPRRNNSQRGDNLPIIKAWTAAVAGVLGAGREVHKHGTFRKKGRCVTLKTKSKISDIPCYDHGSLICQWRECGTLMVDILLGDGR